MRKAHERIKVGNMLLLRIATENFISDVPFRPY
jgi:hypothetical protein